MIHLQLNLIYVMNLTNQPLYLLIKDILTLAITVAGLIIAGKGLSTWSKQIKGGKEFEIGYNLNYAVLKIRKAISYVRNPAIWNSEMENAKEDYKLKHPNSSNEDQEKNANSHVYVLRWKKITEADTEMESYLLGAEILWEKEILFKMKLLNECIKKLNLNLFYNFNLDVKRTAEEREKIFKIVYNQGTEDSPDEFSKEVNEAVKIVHDYIKSKK
jgi:hypothetical protein